MNSATNSSNGTHCQDDTQHKYPPAILVRGALLREQYDAPLQNTDRRPSLDDCEANIIGAFDFTEKSIRRSFIRKVLALVLCQLLVMTTIITVFSYHEPAKYIASAARVQNVVILMLAVMFFALLSMLCCKEIRRTVPLNFIFLGVVTVTLSISLGVLISQYVDELSFMAILFFGFTAAILLSLLLFTFQTKWDLTTMSGFLVTFLMVVIVFGALALFLPTWKVEEWAKFAFLIFIFAFYIVLDIQLMVGGTHYSGISPEEYVFAALVVYIDIIILILRLIARAIVSN